MAMETRPPQRRGLPELFDWFEGLPSSIGGLLQPSSSGLRVEEYAEDNKYVVCAEIPGVDPEEGVSVQVANGTLTIKAEREETQHEGRRTEFRYGTLTRTLQLPDGAEESEIEASYENGILQISIPVKEKPQEVTRTIPVQRH